MWLTLFTQICPNQEVWLKNSLSVGDVESPGQDSGSLSSPSSKPPLVDVTLSDWCITNLFPYFHNRKNHWACVQVKISPPSLQSPRWNSRRPLSLGEFDLQPPCLGSWWCKGNSCQSTDLPHSPFKGFCPPPRPQVGSQGSPDQWRSATLISLKHSGGRKPIC